MAVLSPNYIPAYIKDSCNKRTKVLRPNKIPTYIEYVRTKRHVSTVAYNFKTKLRPGGPKKLFLETGPPTYLRVWMIALTPSLSQGLDPAPV